MDNLLPNVLGSAKHISDLDKVADARLAAIETESLLVYLIDTVQPQMLDYLATQFDVRGYRGFRLATTDKQKREVIKNAINLKRYMGTVWAVKQAMIAVGYGGAQLQERSGTVGDGRDWARFKVVADLGNNQGLDAETPAELTNLINEYKNARSVLTSIEYNCNVSDTIPTPSEVLDFEYRVDLVDSLFTGGFKYDGTYKYDGSQKYRPGIEDFNAF